MSTFCSISLRATRRGFEIPRRMGVLLLRLGAALALGSSAQATQLRTLAALNGANGNGPVAGLVQAADGTLYGTASTGGRHGTGTIFRVNPKTGALTTLYSFSAPDRKGNDQDGSSPNSALVIGTDHNLYGMTEFGGSNRN